MTFENWITLITVITAVVSLIIACLSLEHQQQISYPRIQIDNVGTFFSSVGRCLKYSESEKRLYLLIKLKVSNLSPVPGNVYNFFFKDLFICKVPALNKNEIENLSDETKNFINSFFGKNITLVDNVELVKPFEEKIICLVFKLPYNFVPPQRISSYSIHYSFYTESKKKCFKLFYLSYWHYAETYNLKKISDILLQKHFRRKDLLSAIKRNRKKTRKLLEEQFRKENKVKR